ncbi:MAG TPA: WGR domain-containing protein [Polyangiaceae bacterium]|nr:WGR domain-containing protein [Polyangiaceae bacterium]
MATRRFVCTEDGSNKFWEGSVEGNSVTTRWGKVGTSGQTKTKAFASPEAAQGELEKLIREKVGKGYVEEGGAPAAGAPPPPPKLGRYVSALIAGLQDRKKRPAPEPTVSAWLAKETRPQLRALFTALAEHDSGAVSVGDFWFNTQGASGAVGGRVPRAGAPDQDRDDVILLGSTGGGDPFVTRVPGTSDDESIWMVVHDEGWSDGERWSDLESFLEERVTSYREAEAEQGTPKSEIRTDLDDYLKRPKAGEAAAGGETTLPGSMLALVADPGPERDNRDAEPKEVSRFFYAARGGEGDWERFWHGRYAFAAIPASVPDFDFSAYQAAVFDRGGAKPEARVVEPRLVRWLSHDANYDSTMLHGWRDDDATLLFAGPTAVEVDASKQGFDAMLERGRGTIVEVVPATGAATVVCAGADARVGCQTADPLLAIGWVGEMVGAIQRGKKGNVLELRAREGDGWKLVATIPCGKSDRLLSLGGQRLAVVTKAKGAKAKSYVLGVRGTELRLLATVEGIFEEAHTLADGRALLAIVKGGYLKWSRVLHIDEALEKAFAEPAGEIVLA